MNNPRKPKSAENRPVAQAKQVPPGFWESIGDDSIHDVAPPKKLKPKKPAVITQQELRDLMDAVHAFHDGDRQWNAMRERLLAGAEVEPGDIVPVIEPDERRPKHCRQMELSVVIGEAAAAAVWAQLTSDKCRRLRLKIGDQERGFSDL